MRNKTKDDFQWNQIRKRNKNIYTAWKVCGWWWWWWMRYIMSFMNVSIWIEGPIKYQTIINVYALSALTTFFLYFIFHLDTCLNMGIRAKSTVNQRIYQPWKMINLIPPTKHGHSLTMLSDEYFFFFSGHVKYRWISNSKWNCVEPSIWSFALFRRLLPSIRAKTIYAMINNVSTWAGYAAINRVQKPHRNLSLCSFFSSSPILYFF